MAQGSGRIDVLEMCSISTAVSCVPDMLGYGERGSLVEPTVENVVNEIQHYIDNPGIYTVKSNKAYNWSRTYTLDKFEESIKELLVEY